MKKIKIAQVITRMDWGGSPDIFRILCERFAPQRYDVRVIVGKTQYPTAKIKAFFAKYRDIVSVIPQLQRDISLFEDMAALVKLYRIFKREKFDIVHTHTAKAGALGRVAAWLAGVPVIIHTPHGHNFYGYFNPLVSAVIILIERALTGITDKIMVLTELEKKDYIAFGAAPQKKLQLIYTGIELEEFSVVTKDSCLKDRFHIGADETVIGFVGRLESVKGPQYLAQAANIVLEKKKNARFVFVGDGSLMQKLKAQLSGWGGLGDKVIFTGWREDIPQIMSMFDILVLPSLNEAVGLVLIEAQSQGIAVVATKVGGIPEIVRDKETGILVNPADSMGLADAIITLLDNPQQRKSYGEAARVFVKDKFSAQTLLGNVSLMYRYALEGKRGSADVISRQGID